MNLSIKKIITTVLFAVFLLGSNLTFAKKSSVLVKGTKYTQYHKVFCHARITAKNNKKKFFIDGLCTITHKKSGTYKRFRLLRKVNKKITRIRNQPFLGRHYTIRFLAMRGGVALVIRSSRNMDNFKSIVKLKPYMNESKSQKVEQNNAQELF